MNPLFEINISGNDEVQQSFLGVSYDTIFTVFTTIIIFFLGYLVNRIIERRKERRRLIDLEDYFKKLVEMLDGPALKQRNALIQLANQLKQKKEGHVIVDDVTTFRVDLILEIDNQDLYTIYIKGRKGEMTLKTQEFQNLRGQLDYFSEIKDYIKSSFEELLKRTEKYNEIFRENLKLTGEAFDSIVASNQLNNITPAQDPFIVQLDTIRATWVQQNTPLIPFQDRFVTRQHYLDPLLVLCRANPADPRTPFFLKHCLECIYAFDNLNELNKVYRRHFLLDARNIHKGMILIKNSIKKFDAMK